jgi:3-oxoacyl-[acyl-carrier protein] reductase
MSQTRRVALVADADLYVGPALARALAVRGHDLVVGNAKPPLVDELESMGAAVEVVPGVRDLSDPTTAQRLVEAGLARFGAIHAAAAFSGQIITGRFLDSTPEQLDKLYSGCMVAPYHFLKAVVAPMVAQRDGQVLMITSAAGGRPTRGAALYSAVRAGATMMAKNVAEEVAGLNVQVNAVGTNFMDFPGFLAASGATDPEVRARIEGQVPMKRLGTMDEFAAFCAVFLDGTSRFTTGQWVGYAGGWV